MIYVLGSGASLNYKVVGGTSAPSNPKENTIWVNTSTAITSHVFDLTQPAGQEGMVWFRTISDSAVKFNALKKNAIQVCPVKAEQYVSGAWVEKTAKIYQNGAWTDLITDMYLYRNGVRNDDITGGFVTAGKKRESGDTATAPRVTYNSTNVKIDHTALGHGIAYFKNKIDLTHYKTLHVKARFHFKNGANNWQHRVCVWSGIGTLALDNVVASWGPATGTHEQTQNVSINVSNVNGSHYIGFYMQTSGTAGDYYVRLDEMWLEAE